MKLAVRELPFFIATVTTTGLYRDPDTEYDLVCVPDDFNELDFFLRLSPEDLWPSTEPPKLDYITKDDSEALPHWCTPTEDVDLNALLTEARRCTYVWTAALSLPWDGLMHGKFFETRQDALRYGDELAEKWAADPGSEREILVYPIQVIPSRAD